MPKQGWLKKIGLLKKLIAEVGHLWPDSTKLAGYAEKGPYHCQNCEYLRGRTEGEIFRDPDNMGRCSQAVMMADPEVKKDDKGFPIVNIEFGCCEFVEPPENENEAS